jgi:hypothetical protein
VFNYLGYARLGALHGLNPYTHILGSEPRDPVYVWISWHHLSSPYGELFTLLTYPLGLMSLPARVLDPEGRHRGAPAGVRVARVPRRSPFSGSTGWR